MPKISDQRRHWLRADKWPIADQAIWREATEPTDEIKLPRYGDDLRAASLVTIEKAYGRYVSFLKEIGELVDTESPSERATPDRVARYVRHLKEFNYRAQSIHIAASGLRAALRILAPDFESSWVWKPNGISVASRLREPRKAIEVPDSGTLYRWGLELMGEGKRGCGKYRDLIKVRDGLMIALVACRPLRRHTVGCLMLGLQVLKVENGWLLRLMEGDMKNKRYTELNVPPSLTEHVAYYLDKIRPALLAGATSEGFWIGKDQQPMTDQAISSMVYRRSEHRFGKPFGIHHFRHAYATTVIDAHPEQPGSAASVLAVGARMVEKHYNLGDTIRASRALFKAIEAEGERWAAFAERRFREKGKD